MTTTSNIPKRFNAKAFIFLLDIIVFFILLKTLPFDEKANKGLALLVFVGVLWLTEVLHVTITALLVPIISIGLGLVTTKNALMAFADPTIFLFFGGFALATALHIQKLDQLIASKIMAMARGRLFLAVIYLFVVTAFLSMWMSNTATAAMMLPLALGILSKLDRTQYHNTYIFVLLGIAYSASIGGMGTLVGSPPNGIVASNLHLSFSDWLQYGVPIVLLLMPMMVLTLYVILKPKFSSNFELNSASIEMNSKRVLTLVIFCLIALCWIFSSHINPIISSVLGLEKNIASFDSLIALLAAVILCAAKVVSWREIQDNTEWGVLMLFGGGLTLSAVLGQTGASKIMADGIVSLIEGGHFYIIGLVVAAFIIFLTEFTSNTAAAALLVPIFISIAEAIGAPPIGLALVIGFGASCAFMLPVATPPNAIVFGSGEIKQSEMVRIGFWLNIMSIFVIATVGYFFWL